MQALVFDFDGLILDTETALFTTTAAVFSDHGVELEAEWWATEILGTAEHPHWTDILEARLGRPLVDRGALMDARNLRYHETLALESVRPGVVALLEEAAVLGVPAAVASSSPRDWVEGHLDRLGLRPSFGAVRTRDDVPIGRTKPAPDLFLVACEALGVDPEASVALEDSPNGVRAAKAAGLTVVGVAAGLTAGLPLDAAGADLVVASLEDVTCESLVALTRA